MKRLFIILTLALSLAGCAGTSIFKGGLDPFATIGNPVTPAMLYNVENSMVVAVSGLLAYKRACADKVIPRSCRGIVASLQVYTRKARPVLTRLRAFVRNNDQVNAISAFNEVRGLLTDFQTTATNAGVR